MCRADETKDPVTWKEVAVWTAIGLFACLAIWGILRHKDKIDGVKLGQPAKAELTVTWLGPISYYSTQGGDNATIGWGGQRIGTQVIDATVIIGLHPNGTVVWKRADVKQ